MLVFTLFFTQVSCKSVSFNTSNFQEVDFSGGQKLHLVEGEDVYNLFISFSENDGLNLKYLKEACDKLTVIKDKYLASGGLNPKALTTNPNKINLEEIEVPIFRYFNEYDFNYWRDTNE